MANPTSFPMIPSYPSSFPSGSMPPSTSSTGNNQPPYFYPPAPIPNTNTHPSGIGIFQQPNYGTSGDIVSIQTFQEFEEIWYRRYELKAIKLTDAHRLREENLMKRLSQVEGELAEKLRIISNLEATLEGQKTKTRKIEETLNLRGGLERIVYQARKLGMIKKTGAPGVQAGLNEIAGTDTFIKALEKELATRKLVERDVKSCIAVLYHEASKHAHGNTGKIIIYHEDHLENERAALVTFFKVQNDWADCLKWDEVPRSEEKV